MKTSVLSAAVTLFTLGAGTTADIPLLKEGLWSAHVVTTGNPGREVKQQTFSICRSHDSDRAEEIAGTTSLPVGCTKSPDVIQGNARSFSISCKNGDKSSITKSVVTYSGDIAFHVEAHTVFTPAVRGHITVDGITDEKYVGPCPAGLKPGQKR